MPLPEGENITELSYGSVANITFSAQCKWDFGTKTKNKMKMKIHFRPKTKKSRKWPNSPSSAPKTKTNIGRLLVWWLDLTDWPWPLRFHNRFTPLPANNIDCQKLERCWSDLALVCFWWCLCITIAEATRSPTLEPSVYMLLSCRSLVELLAYIVN